MEEFAHNGANFSPLRVDPLRREAKTKRVASPKSVPIHLLMLVTLMGLIIMSRDMIQSTK